VELVGHGHKQEEQYYTGSQAARSFCCHHPQLLSCVGACDSSWLDVVSVISGWDVVLCHM
jgi:hypothetical protein